MIKKWFPFFSTTAIHVVTFFVWDVWERKACYLDTHRKSRCQLARPVHERIPPHRLNEATTTITNNSLVLTVQPSGELFKITKFSRRLICSLYFYSKFSRLQLYFVKFLFFNSTLKFAYGNSQSTKPDEKEKTNQSCQSGRRGLCNFAKVVSNGITNMLCIIKHRRLLNIFILKA